MSGRDPVRFALGLKPDGEAVEARRRVGMLGAEHFLVDRQRALEELPCRFKLALIPKQYGEIVEAPRGSGMPGAERILADRQRALEEQPRA